MGITWKYIYAFAVAIGDRGIMYSGCLSVHPCVCCPSVR